MKIAWVGGAAAVAAVLEFSGLVGAKVTSLQIGVKHRPVVCPLKSQNGDELSMHYSGFLEDGESFDSSVSRGTANIKGTPFDFTIGAGQVIAGWEQGLLDMCVGEKRKLKIPSTMGYGERGSGKIPGGATLIFEVELLEIKNRQPGRAEL